MAEIIKIHEGLVEKFLLENKFIWNGVVYNVDGEEKEATYEDFDGTLLYMDVVNLHGKETIKVIIDPVSFKMYKFFEHAYDHNKDIDYLYKDLSKDWIKFLLKHNKNNSLYRQHVMSYCNHRIGQHEQVYNKKNEEHLIELIKIKKEYQDSTKDYLDIVDYLNKEHKRGRK